MRYYIIAGEASGDLHGSNLMRGIYEKDPNAIIRFWGGDLMNGVFVEHQKCVPQDKEQPAGISTETRTVTEDDQKVFCSPSFGLPNPRSPRDYGSTPCHRRLNSQPHQSWL